MTAAIDLRTEDVTAFSAAAEFTGVLAKDRAGWLMLRRSMLTASDVASVLDLDDSPPKYRRSPLAVYTEKILEPTGLPPPAANDVTPEALAAMPPFERRTALRSLFNDARFWGAKLEQTILTTVAEYSGWDYREGGALLRSREVPWLGCTLDAEIDRHDGRGWCDLEGKTSIMRHGWDEEEMNLPQHILIQVQAQLFVTGAPVAVVVALLQGSTCVQIPIEPDISFHEMMVEECGAFMERVNKMDPPPADWRDSDLLNRLFASFDGATVDLPDECTEWVREALHLADQLKSMHRQQDAIRNRLKQKIGSATYGLLSEPVDGKVAVRWKANKVGQRVLTFSKKFPPGARLHGGNEAATANDPLVDALAESVQELDDAISAPPVRFIKGRRRGRA